MDSQHDHKNNVSEIRRTWTHKFLNKKYWHPQNPRNLEKKWLAEEKQRQEKLKNEQAVEELKDEAKHWEQLQKLDENQKGVTVQKRSVAFLYMKPPGYIDQQQQKAVEQDTQKNEGAETKFYGRLHATVQVPLLDGCTWSNKHVPHDRCPRGGFSPNHPNQQLILPTEEEEIQDASQNLEQDSMSVKNSQKKAKQDNVLQLSKLGRRKLKKIVKQEIRKRKERKKQTRCDLHNGISGTASQICGVDRNIQLW